MKAQGFWSATVSHVIKLRPSLLLLLYKELACSESHHSNVNAQVLRMPASPNGFGHYFVDRNVSMPAGYQMLGCAPGVPPPPHLAAMAGMSLPFSGIPGYTFIPFPHAGHMAHMVRSIIFGTFHSETVNSAFLFAIHTCECDLGFISSK